MSTFTTQLPEPLYTSAQVRENEPKAAAQSGCSMFELMQRAGQAVFDLLTHQYPNARHVLVCCGKGNNGGDGYIVAHLALQAGLKVSLWQIGDANDLKGDAQQAMQHYLKHGGEISTPTDRLPNDVDVIIDGLLGTGIQGEVRPQFAAVIKTLNQAAKPIIAIDTPSGLHTDNGIPLGDIIQAVATVSFIGLKRGLVTGQAREYVGTLYFAGLEVNEQFDSMVSTTTYLTNANWLSPIQPRLRHAHKGTSGKSAFIGGNEGFSGAIYLAAKAAARSGAGMLSVVCHAESTSSMRALLPEAMTSVAGEDTVLDKLEWADVACLGPGLGRDHWGEALFLLGENECMHSQKLRVLDADALHWLGRHPQLSYSNQRIMTPHPGEAATLLGESIIEVEFDRFAAADNLQGLFGGVVVLKGAGTIIQDGTKTLVCHAGNPGMATGGMGDVLSGIITALLAQGYSLEDAATLGTLIHSMAADEHAAQYGEIGLLASDLFDPIRHIINASALHRKGACQAIS